MGSLESLWRDRGINLEPLELRQSELREEIAQHFATLQAQVNSSVDFNKLLETGKSIVIYMHLNTLSNCTISCMCFKDSL